MEPVADLIDHLYILCYAWRHTILLFGIVAILGLFLVNLKSGWHSPAELELSRPRRKRVVVKRQAKSQEEIDREHLLHA